MIMQGSIFQKANKNDYNRWKKHILRKNQEIWKSFSAICRNKAVLTLLGYTAFYVISILPVKKPYFDTRF